MPFKSSKQEHWMFANKPTMARRFSQHAPTAGTAPAAPKVNVQPVKPINFEALTGFLDEHKKKGSY